VVYWTRTQTERHQATSNLVINTEALELMKKDAILLHPLPRIGEIAKEVDDNPHAKYFEQAGFGMYIRMALLEMLLNGTL